MRRAAGIICTAALLGAIGAAAYAATLDKPIPGEVFVKGPGRATPLKGSLVQFDDRTFTMRVGADDRTLNWTDVTPATAFVLRQKTVDRSKPDQLFALGRFGWSIGAKDQAQTALRSAVRMDAGLKTQVDALLLTPPGSAVPATQPKGRELIKEGTAYSDGKGRTGTTPGKPPADAADGPPVKFQPATPEQAAEAMARNRKQADSVQEKIGVTLHEFETDHFIVFTDWDKGDYDFLKTNLEGAYRVVATQFEMSPKDNVFVGKLPVYMLDKYSDFAAFAKDIDKFADVNKNTAGYYMGDTRGFGHMAMWKPNQSLTGTNSLDDARRLWAYVLVHEFTHAFLARYKSNVFVPRWLNEGIAEVIASNQFPMTGRRRMAKLIASGHSDLSPLFDDANRPGGELYPVMQSMVELLVSQNKDAFLKLIDLIKAGKRPERALMETYHVDYEQFTATWRNWARRLKDD